MGNLEKAIDAKGNTSLNRGLCVGK